MVTAGRLPYFRIGYLLNNTKNATSTMVAGTAIHQLRTSWENTTANQPCRAMKPTTTPKSINRLGEIPQNTITITMHAIPRCLSKSEFPIIKLITAHKAAIEANVPSAMSRYHHSLFVSKPKASCSLFIVVIVPHKHRARQRKLLHQKPACLLWYSLLFTRMCGGICLSRWYFEYLDINLLRPELTSRAGRDEKVLHKVFNAMHRLRL